MAESSLRCRNPHELRDTGSSRVGSTVAFDSSADYERFMGRWGRAAAASFLDWLAPPCGLRWLDVGCGTGTLADRCWKTVRHPLLWEWMRLRPRSNMRDASRLRAR